MKKIYLTKIVTPALLAILLAGSVGQCLGHGGRRSKGGCTCKRGRSARAGMQWPLKSLQKLQQSHAAARKT